MFTFHFFRTDWPNDKCESWTRILVSYFERRTYKKWLNIYW
jgi:hypothetical protein